MPKSKKDSVNDMKSDQDSLSNKQLLNRKKKRDSNTSSDKFVYSKQFYDYLSKLDSREVDYKTIFKDEISPNLMTKSDNQNDYLIDLRIRMANFANSAYRFKIEANGSGTGYSITIYDKNKQERKNTVLF